eukprot:TRINITY_DN75089_c0_g1_i1.p3 TRINITY_DN75089_c0_g1~~TRINITY_DN75089_c0_g1_i1.p3  ORF type:complete len:103 (-),score=11.24 TRINITY_DN75089_c0_g1_i1:221-529(-)
MEDPVAATRRRRDPRSSRQVPWPRSSRQLRRTLKPFRGAARQPRPAATARGPPPCPQQQDRRVLGLRQSRRLAPAGADWPKEELGSGALPVISESFLSMVIG